MKKSLVALAVAAALPAIVQAQTTPTLRVDPERMGPATTPPKSLATSIQLVGSIDVGIESVNDDANGGVSDVRISNGIWSGSRLAVVGSEDLGGSLRALFNIEHRLSPDTGTVTGGATFWAGQSWVGLGGGFGTIRLGRQYTPLFRSLVPSDTTGYSWYVNAFGLGGTQGRFANDLSYESPKLGGFTIHAAYAAGEDPANNKLGDTFGVSGVGNIGPFSIGLGYHNTDSGTAADDRKEFGAALGFKLSRFGVGLGYAKTELAANNETKGAYASLSAVLGAGTAYLVYKRTDAQGPDNAFNQIGLTYSHGLSKRTFLYATAELSKQDRAGALADLKPRRIGIGIRHFF